MHAHTHKCTKQIQTDNNDGLVWFSYKIGHLDWFLEKTKKKKRWFKLRVLLKKSIK